jgi:hypothetical protein
VRLIVLLNRRIDLSGLSFAKRFHLLRHRVYLTIGVFAMRHPPQLLRKAARVYTKAP